MVAVFGWENEGDGHLCLFLSTMGALSSTKKNILKVYTITDKRNESS
jgi:hypothetical protein